MVEVELYRICHERFEYREDLKGLVIKKSGQWAGLVGERPGNLRKDNRRLIQIKYLRYFEHQLVWLMFNGSLPNDQIDHINCDPTDNRIENLRLATNAQNSANRPLQSNSTTGYKGVSLRKDLIKKKYSAHIKHLGKVICLGYFRTKEEAAKAYDKAALELFGEFARLNFGD